MVPRGWRTGLRRCVVAFVVVGLVGQGLVASAQEAPSRFVRLAGADRIGTAVAVSAYAFSDGAPTAFLARADAVAAGCLIRGPVLLVPTTLPAPMSSRGLKQRMA